MSLKSHEDYAEELRVYTKGKIVPVEKYAGARAKILHRCLSCTWEWSAYPTNLLRGLSVCPECTGQRNKTLTTEQYQRKLKDRKIEVLGEYVLSRAPIRHRCLVCRLVWSASPDNVLNVGSGCPACACETRNKSFRGVNFVLNGRTYRLQGFEPQALRYIESRGANLEKLAVDVLDGKPTIRYRFKGKRRLYIPDFFYSPKNRIVEVKSIWTLLGEYNGNDMFAKNKKKARACLKAGYNFSMLVFDGRGERLPLPTNWHRLSKKKLRAELKCLPE